MEGDVWRELLNAEQLMLIGREQEAADAARRILQGGIHADALNLLARAVVDRDPSEAYEAALAAVGAAPEDSSHHVVAAYTALRAKKRNAALDHAEAAQTLDPTSSEAHRMVAEALLVSSRKKARLIRAQAAARQATDLDPDDAANWVTLGRVAAVANDDEEAGAAYRTALSLDPDDAVARRNLATLQRNQGDLVSALELVRSVIVLDPSDPSSRNEVDGIVREFFANLVWALFIPAFFVAAFVDIVFGSGL